MYTAKDGKEPLLSDAALKKSIHMNITRNASAKNYLKYCKLLNKKYPNVINPLPSGHTEIEFYNLKSHFLHPDLQKPEHKVQPRFKKQPNPSRNHNRDPGAPFWPRDARYNHEPEINSILPNEGFHRIQNIINGRNIKATGGSKRGRLPEDSFPDAKRRRMSNSGRESHRL